MLAARGLLKCPDHKILVSIFAEKGIDLELTKELYYNTMLSAASLNRAEEVETAKKEIIKILFPDFKSNDDKLIEQAQQLMQDGKHMRVHVDTRAVIRDEDPLKKFKKS